MTDTAETLLNEVMETVDIYERDDGQFALLGVVERSLLERILAWAASERSQTAAVATTS